jgi:hypothetical protein
LSLTITTVTLPSIIPNFNTFLRFYLKTRKSTGQSVLKIQYSFNRPTTKIAKPPLISLAFIQISFQEKRRVELQNAQPPPSIPPTGSMNTSPHYPLLSVGFDPKYQDRQRRDNINL